MRTFHAIVERDSDTGLLVGSQPPNRSPQQTRGSGLGRLHGRRYQVKGSNIKAV